MARCVSAGCNCKGGQVNSKGTANCRGGKTTRPERPPVKISKYTLEELKKVQQSGLTNMFDKNEVYRIACEWNLVSLCGWIETHTSGQYGRLIMGDYEVPDA